MPDRTLAPGEDIVAVLNRANAGDIIFLKPGVYNIGSGNTISADGSKSKPIAISTLPGRRKAIIKGHAHWLGANWLIVRNVVFDMAGAIERASAIRSDNLTFIGVEWRRGARTGVYVGPESENTHFYKSRWFRNGRRTNTDHGLYDEGRFTFCLKCISARNAGAGFHLYNEGVGGLFVKSRALFNSRGDLKKVGSGPLESTGRMDGFFVGSGSRDIRIFDSASIGNGNHGFRCFECREGWDNRLDNVITWGNQKGAVRGDFTSVTGHRDEDTSVIPTSSRRSSR